MLAKYINENQIDYNRSKIILNDKLIINPTDEQLKAAGYLEVEERNYAENATFIYSLENGKIIKSYILIENSKETAQPNADEAFNEFISTLASSETNSIAKIRAAAQKFLDNTEVIQ